MPTDCCPPTIFEQVKEWGEYLKTHPGFTFLLGLAIGMTFNFFSEIVFVLSIWFRRKILGDDLLSASRKRKK